MVRIQKIEGSKPGVTTTIMAGVHGNERSGVYALEQIRTETIETGIVYLIIANEDALNRTVRYIDTDMNRSFGTNRQGIEGECVDHIISYLYDSDYLIDIHNTTSATSPLFLISEHPDLTQYFDVDIVVSGLDILHPGGSDGRMNAIGRQGICIECGSIADPIEQTTAFAYDTITNMLIALGHRAGRAKKYNQTRNIQCQSIYTKKSSSFRWMQEVYDFCPVQKKQLLAMDGDQAIYAQDNGFILFPISSQYPHTECFVFGVAAQKA